MAIIQVQNSTLDALLQHFSSSEDLSGSDDNHNNYLCCDLELSFEDSSTVSSDISSGDEDEQNNKDDENKSSSLQIYNHLRNPFGVYREHSWTIHLFERNRKAGDAIWFRAWRNDKHDFVELEDWEILSFVESHIECEPNSCFYLKLTQRGGFTTFALLDKTLIGRALRRVLEQAQERDRLYIPSKTWLEQVILREERAKKGFFSRLRFARA